MPSLRMCCPRSSPSTASTTSPPAAPFRRIALQRRRWKRYGSDKPDLRIDLMLQGRHRPVRQTATLSRLPGQDRQGRSSSPDCHLTRKQIDKLCADVEVQAGMKAYWFNVWTKTASWPAASAKFVQDKQGRSSPRRSASKPGMLCRLTAGKKRRGRRRPQACCARCSARTVEGHMDKERYEFCWIVDFPMYEIGEESGELEFCHNPFSMPQRRPGDA